MLWGTQDEAAYADPGAGLDADVRGRMQEAIGRQVATVLGGLYRGFEAVAFIRQLKELCQWLASWCSCGCWCRRTRWSGCALW